MAYNIAKFKLAIMRLWAKAFYPWYNGTDVRVLQAYPIRAQFDYVYPRAVQARKEGYAFIQIDLPEGLQEPKYDNVIKMSNFSKGKKRK